MICDTSKFVTPLTLIGQLAISFPFLFLGWGVCFFLFFIDHIKFKPKHKKEKREILLINYLFLLLILFYQHVFCLFNKREILLINYV